MPDLAQSYPNDAPERLIELGRIVAAHGVKGWVKVEPYAGQRTILLGVKTWWLGYGQGTSHSLIHPVTVQAAKHQGNTLIAQLQGIADRAQAEALRGRTVAVPRSTFPAPEVDEYYWVDLIDCLVYGRTADAGEPVLLGRVNRVSDNGAHALLGVTRLKNDVPVLDAKGRAVELLVPFVAAHVCSVDLVARRIDTDWPADF